MLTCLLLMHSLPPRAAPDAKLPYESLAEPSMTPAARVSILTWYLQLSVWRCSSGSVATWPSPQRVLSFRGHITLVPLGGFQGALHLRVPSPRPDSPTPRRCWENECISSPGHEVYGMVCGAVLHEMLFASRVVWECSVYSTAMGIWIFA